MWSECDLLQTTVTLDCIFCNCHLGSAEGWTPKESHFILWPNVVWMEGMRGSKVEPSCWNECEREAGIGGRAGGTAVELWEFPLPESALGVWGSKWTVTLNKWPLKHPRPPPEAKANLNVGWVSIKSQWPSAHGPDLWGCGCCPIFSSRAFWTQSCCCVLVTGKGERCSCLWWGTRGLPCLNLTLQSETQVLFLPQKQQIKN